MYISTIAIQGYKIFKEEFKITLNPGLNIILGENASGKSAIIDAIRLILQEDEYGRAGINPSDFHRPLSNPAKHRGADKIKIRLDFDRLTNDEQVAYLPWLDINNPVHAILNLSIENKEDARGKLKRKIWGNESESGIFEWELLNRIACIYLPPLRNAEEKLRAYKGSRLARLLKNMRKDAPADELHPLEKKFSAFNKDLLRDDTIKAANQSIQGNLAKAVGSIFGQDASIQFTEVNFDRIVERLRLLFYPLLPKTGETTKLDMFRDLDENSLGYNNILYLATVLAELEGLEATNTSHKVLLIEEPEAHLHPQLQIRLLQFLEEKAAEDKIQIIVTSHSPTLASSVGLEAIKLMTIVSPEEAPVFTSITNCNLSTSTKFFLERWLDITKSLLFFAKGVLLVEGIAEALVVKELAKIVLSNLKANNPDKFYCKDLEEYGISLVNQNGLYFDRFMSLFQGYFLDLDGNVQKCAGVPVKCAGITDNDPEKESQPTPDHPSIGKNPRLDMIPSLIANSTNCRLFTNLKTFEYDLAMIGNNLVPMSEVQLALTTTDGPNKQQLESYIATDWAVAAVTEKAAAAYWLLIHIDKGEYAQALAEKIASQPETFNCPTYIEDAIKWLINE